MDFRIGREKKHSIPLATSIVEDIVNKSQFGGVISSANMVELFKAVYSRAVNFVGSVEDFKNLQDTVKKALLSKNLDMLSTIQLATCLNDDGSINLSKICQIVQVVGQRKGFDDLLNEKPIKIEQVFVEPWAKSESHKTKYAESLNSWEHFSRKTK